MLPARGIEVDLDRGTILVTATAREALEIRTVEVLAEDLVPKITCNARIVLPWNRHALISTPLAGRIAVVHRPSGARVQKGEVLAELVCPQLEELQNELRAGIVQRSLSERVVLSTQEASRSGAIPAIRAREAESQLRQAEAILEVALARWRGLGLPEETLAEMLANPDHRGLSQLPLASPIDGILTHTDLSVGKYVSSQEHLFEVIDPRELWLRIGVLEKDLPSVQRGQTITFIPSAGESKPIIGKIDVVDRYLDRGTQLGVAWVTLPQEEAGLLPLRPGMTGVVDLDQESGPPRPVVPRSAIFRSGTERFVLIEQLRSKKASLFRRQPIVLGHHEGAMVQVIGGELYPGDQVVTQGIQQLGGFFAPTVLRLSPEGAADFGVEVAPAELQRVARTLTIEGMVDIPATHRGISAALSAGRIEKIHVDRGSSVQPGTVVAEIFSQDFQHRQLAYLQAALTVEMSQQLVDSYRSAGTAIPQRQLWEAESALAQETSQRDALEQQLVQLGMSPPQLRQILARREVLRLLPVTAPIAGEIVGFDQFLGKMVQAEEGIFAIHDCREGWIQGFVSERDLPRIEIDQRARIRFASQRDRAYAGVIRRSGQSLDGNDHTLSIWVELLEKPPFALQHAMMATMTIELEEGPEVLAVPRSAVVWEGSQALIFVQREDRAFERRRVVTGRRNDQWIMIAAGLQRGEKVATRGAGALQTGYASIR